MNYFYHKILSGIISAFCFLLISIHPALAQSTKTDTTKARLLTSFPFITLSGGIVIVDALFEDHGDTLHFILDTGSGGISLDSTTAERMGIVKEPSSKMVRGIGGVKNVNFTHNRTLRFPGLEVDSLSFHINDYGLLSSVYGIKIDGIIGYSFLKRYIVALDYDKSIIEVYSPGKFNYKPRGHCLIPNFSTIPMQSVTVKDKNTVTSNYYFDLGAGLCMLFSDNFLNEHGFIKPNRGYYPAQVEGIGGKTQLHLTVINEVKLGPYRFRKVPVYVLDDEFNVTSYPVLGGLIGNDILRRFNVVLNYPEKRIYIRPNSHFHDLFDYAYTGLGVYMEGSSIVIADVIKDSPGDKCGLKPGDVIISVANNISNNITVYKTLLQNTDSKIKMIVRRDNSLHTTFLAAENILKNNKKKEK